MGRRNTEIEFVTFGTNSSNLMLGTIGCLAFALIPLVMWIGVWPLLAIGIVATGIRIAAEILD